MRISLKLILFALLLILLNSCSGPAKQMAIESSQIRIEFNKQLNCRLSEPGKKTIPLMSHFQASDYLLTAKGAAKNFMLKSAQRDDFTDSIGSGQKLMLTGQLQRGNQGIQKNIEVKIYSAFPSLSVTRVSYVNIGQEPINIKGWVRNQFTLQSLNEQPAFWSFQGATYEERPDWVLPLTHPFKRENYLGMNASDYGGGIPVVDIWRKDVGLAIGHLSPQPELVSMPVSYDSLSAVALFGITMKVDSVLQPNQELKTLPAFVSIHHGDYFKTLQTYSRFMQKQGMRFQKFPETAYQPVWCAWGYERNFTPQQVLNTLPKVKKLGFKWAVLDDGWQTAEGDWFLNPKKFPNGDADMRAFVKKIHAAGLKAKLWWAPMAADPGTKLLKEHPDLLLINKNGKPQDISWWDSYYLCPAYAPVMEYTKKLIHKIIVDWDYDGLKIDGQYLNAVPPCYNPKHHHKSPLESVHKLPDFFRVISETVHSLKADAVVEICPCGTASSFFNMPFMNQPVSSDPTSSWQIRLKGKTYKALMGPTVPYYGDHVELSDGKDDFASTIGIGGVPGSKFTWPVGVHINQESGDVSLTPQKEKEWQKWLTIYETYQLPRGQYLGGLYDIGFDKPETHVIKKDGKWFYAFYAKNFSGKIELRGLPQKGKFTVTDYEHGKPLGTVNANNPVINVNFTGHLLVVVGKNSD